MTNTSSSRFLYIFWGSGLLCGVPDSVIRKHLGFITDSRHLREFATKTFFPNEIVFSSSDGLKSDTTHI